MEETFRAEGSSQETAVRGAVSMFSRAFVDADVAGLESFLTNGYIHVNGRTGTVLHRKDWLDWMESRRMELENGQLIFHDYRIEEGMVSIYENVALVSGVAYSSGIHKGEEFTSHVRFTNTWILVDNRWRRAAFHDSPMPE